MVVQSWMEVNAFFPIVSPHVKTTSGALSHAQNMLALSPYTRRVLRGGYGT